MRYLFAFLLLFCAGMAHGQSGKTKPRPKPFKMAPAPGKADSTVLKQYWFVMLVKGRDRDKITDTAVINRLQAGHMANMARMAEAGKLIVAGPFGDDGTWRGLFIFDCDTQQEVEELLAADPAIKAGRMDYEIHPWWTGMNTVFK